MGESGTGKTTFVNLFLGLLQPTKGEIKVDDTCINQSYLPSFQRITGYVPQEIYLLDDSLRRNVAFGVEDDDINDDRVFGSFGNRSIKKFSWRK